MFTKSYWFLLVCSYSKHELLYRYFSNFLSILKTLLLKIQQTVVADRCSEFWFPSTVACHLLTNNYSSDNFSYFFDMLQNQNAVFFVSCKLNAQTRSLRSLKWSMVGGILRGSAIHQEEFSRWNLPRLILQRAILLIPQKQFDTYNCLKQLPYESDSIYLLHRFIAPVQNFKKFLYG